MSRFERSNEKYRIAFGVDHVIGSFCQVWHKQSRSEGPVISVDNMGVEVSTKPLKRLVDRELMPSAVLVWVKTCEASFAAAKKRGVLEPNVGHEAVTKLFELLGFTDIGREVFAAFD